jgi:hypothetical protein
MGNPARITHSTLAIRLSKALSPRKIRSNSSSQFRLNRREPLRNGEGDNNMSRLMGLASIAASLFLFAGAQGDGFSKYRAVEAYEIRPGILMMPKYASDKQVCEIVLERHHYSNETASLDSTMPREVITQIADELAPPRERGPLTTALGRDYLSAYSGNSVTTFADYKNVSIRIFGIASPAGTAAAGDVVAVIHWNDRKCQ